MRVLAKCTFIQVELTAEQPRFDKCESSLIVTGSFAHQFRMCRNVLRQKSRQESPR
jgi:hypothetical protein